MNLRPLKRFSIAIAGGLVLAAGLVMVILPGPAFLVIPAGLAILGVEFAWAKRWLETIKRIALLARARLQGHQAARKIVKPC